jgi:hypothetical protein
MIVKVKNMNVLIDSKSRPIFDMFNWHISDTGYIVWRGILGGRKKTLRLHRLIVGAGDGDIVDHINRDKLDNRTSNLRVVDMVTNARNSDRYDNAKQYYFDKTKNRWCVDSKRHGIRSLYMESEKDCKEYVKQLEAGKRPVRVFVRRANLGGRKLSDSQIEYIFAQHSLGRTNRSIAQDIMVSNSTVWRTINGKTKIGGKAKGKKNV